MGLFHKPSPGKKKLSRKERKANKKAEKLAEKRKKWKRPYAPYKIPPDVKYFFVMPVLFVVAWLSIGLSLGLHFHNVAVYKQHVMESAMPQGSVLPLWGGTEKGQLKLGQAMRSKDGKTLAVEVKYDDNAHQDLSSFGNKYGLRLVEVKDKEMKHPSLSYGLFGTDGSGVLTIHNPNGFANQAFVVMIMDKGHLVSSEDLSNATGNTQTTSDAVDKSVTAQLSDADNTANGSDNTNSSQRKKLPPIYYMRLNASNAPRAKRNWSNDRQMVEDLFINKNLKKLRQQRNKQRNIIKETKISIKEYQARLKENPQDQTAISQLNQRQSDLQTAQANLDAVNKNYNKVAKSAIKPNILQPKQTKHQTFSVNSLNEFNGNNQN